MSLINLMKLPQKKHFRKSPALDEDLKIIYGNTAHKKCQVSLASLERATGSGFSRPLVWTLALLVILAALGWGGYTLFGNPFETTQTESIDLTIDGPDEVISGSSVRYEIRYANTGRYPIAALELQLIAPSGLLVSKLDPAPTNEDDEWTIGSVTPGSDGLIVLTGIWIDPVPSAQTLQVLTSYRPSNFNADFQDITTKSVSINRSTLAIESDGVESAKAGESVSYLYRVKNEGEVAASNVRLRLDVPKTFALASADPMPPDSGTEWMIDALQPGASYEVTIKGSFASDGVGLQEIPGRVGVMRDISFLEQAVVIAQTDVEEADVKVTLIANGSTTDQAIDLADTLRVSLSAETDTPAEATLKLILESDGELPIDWKNADLDEGKRHNGIITWEATTQADLALPISSAGSFFMTAEVVAQNLTIRSSPMKIFVNSDLSLSVQAHYYLDDTPVGTGPLPPLVGQMTTYRLVWEIQNSGHAIEDLVVKATVPTTATFQMVRETSMGTVDYDAASRTVSWTINALSLEQGSASTSFDISITPEGSDIGSYVKLLNETRLTATDAQTDGVISRSVGVLTTDINDPGTEEKGVVGE